MKNQLGFYGAQFEKTHCPNLDEKLNVEMLILECCIEGVTFRRKEVENSLPSVCEGLYMQFLRTQAVVEEYQASKG